MKEMTEEEMKEYYKDVIQDVREAQDNSSIPLFNDVKEFIAWCRSDLNEN